MNRVWVYKQVILVITSPSKQLYSWQEGDLSMMITMMSFISFIHFILLFHLFCTVVIGRLNIITHQELNKIIDLKGSGKDKTNYIDVRMAY